MSKNEDSNKCSRISLFNRITARKHSFTPCANEIVFMDDW